jgi:hypothetical protein
MMTMPKRLPNAGLAVSVALFCAMLLGGCRPVPPAYSPFISPSSVPVISQDVRRVAVFYPPSQERDVAYGYAKLEQAVLQATRQRPGIRVLDRRHLVAVTMEQRLQLSVRFSDDNAVHLGRLVGADSIVVFHIDGPSWRDRLLARMHGTMPPVAVTSKVVQVETGEVLYHDMVIRTPVPDSQGWDAYNSDYELQPLLRSALDQSLAEAIANLGLAFR